MAPAWLIGGRVRGTAYYNYYISLCKRIFNNNSSELVRSFTTTSNNNFDDLFQSDPNNRNPTTISNSPPHPIPNRPLRGDNNNRNRRPSRFENNNLNRDKGGADFLERFKLGIENKDKENKMNSNQTDGFQAETASGAAAAESEAVAVAPPQDADEIFKKMKETGLIPNAVAMLDGLCKDGLVQEAMKLFGLMREKGTIPEVVIYTAVFEGFCKAHKFDDAVRIFRKMQSNNVVPNAFSYGLLIQGLCKGKRLDDALEFSVEALEAGHSLNLATFTGLVDGFCREKGLEDAKSLIATLRQKGFLFDEKSLREYLEKKGPFLPVVWEAIIGKKASQRSSFFD